MATTSLFDGAHAYRAVGASSCQNSSNHARTGPTSGGSKKRIDRGTVQVLFWPMHEFDVAIFDQ